MSILIFGRCSVMLLLAALVSGCSMFGSDHSSSSSSRARSGSSASVVSSECGWNRSRCMYEGQYEPDERGYAEEEARRLNQASAARFRRSTGR